MIIYHKLSRRLPLPKHRTCTFRAQRFFSNKEAKSE